MSASGGASATHGGHQKPPLYCQHWVWDGWWSGTITKMVKAIASWEWEFPKEQSLAEDKLESGNQKYSKCQTPPIWKKQVTFKWIFRWFYAFWDPIFLWKLVWKIPHFFFFFFWTLPLVVLVKRNTTKYLFKPAFLRLCQALHRINDCVSLNLSDDLSIY